MKLSKRLEKVAKLVRPGHIVAEVGCDHGYLSIYLIKNKISPMVIATDVNCGPLGRVKKNIKIYGVEEKVKTRLSDGLENLEPGEVDTIVMAGMGGKLILDILRAKPALVICLKELILQPQSDIYKVRKYVQDIGFRIIDEKMIQDGDKYYTAFKAERILMTDSFKPPIDLITQEADLYYGKILLEKKDPVLYKFLKEEKEKRSKIIEKIKFARSEESLYRKKEIIKEKMIIENAIKRYNKN